MLHSGIFQHVLNSINSLYKVAHSKKEGRQVHLAVFFCIKF